MCTCHLPHPDKQNNYVHFEFHANSLHDSVCIGLVHLACKNCNHLL
nr:hypothetical protein Iba_chr04bCG1920 [Ipomoea batatas]